MTTVLWIGSLLGAVAGLVHAVSLYRRWAAWPGTTPSAVSRSKAIYRSLWALGLWTLFGSYLLVLWVLGAIALSLSSLVPGRGRA